MRKRIFAKISGTVHGIGFRYFVTENAGGFNLDGYVKNNYNDGTVEVEAEGEETGLLSLVEKLKEGPMSSAVRGVDVKWSEDRNEFRGFKVR